MMKLTLRAYQDARSTLPARQRGQLAPLEVKSFTFTPPGVLSFRQPRAIDYSSPRVMRARRRQKLAQRQQLVDEGKFVIGCWQLLEGKIVLAAVRRRPTWEINDADPLTTNPREMARWRTKQGARQWMKRHERPRCHLVNIDRLHDPRAGEELVK